MATPYVISSDLVSAYPAKSLEIAQYIDGFKADLALVQNAQTGTTYTFVAADFTKLVTLSNASPVAVTLPLESSVPWPAGTQLRLLNQGAGLVTVAGDVGVTINGTPLTLAQYKAAVITKTGTDTWTILPFSGGSATAVISSTTGSPTITSDSNYTYYNYTGNGTLVVGTEGVCDVLVIGGGGGGGGGAAGYTGGGGGAGGYAYLPTFLLAAGTTNITVASNGTAGNYGVTFATNGGNSMFGYVACGGGGGGGNSGSAFPSQGLSGASGGGGGAASAAGGSATFGSQGSGGETGGAGTSGGAGGGASGTSAGIANSISGASVTYAAGGAAGGGAAGAANSGNGGGGGSSAVGAAGGSGVVIVRVAN
jgi:fibronectin-binding autotransporter adhesin